MRTPLRILGATVAVAAVAATIPLLTSPEAQAVGFTGGDLVVYRVGTGSAPLTNAATAVFLDEYTAAGTRLQSIALPTATVDGNLPLTAAGQSRSEGLLSRSPDGRYVALTGYAAAPGATGPAGASLTASDPVSVKRVVGLVDRNGIVDTSTALAGSSSPQIIRSAVTSNGDEVFAAGGNGGVLKTSLGSTTTTVVAGTADSNLSSLTAQGGTVLTSGILTDRLAAVGAGSLTAVPGLPENLLTYGYAALDLSAGGWNGTTIDTLYLANASDRGGTVDKFRFSGGTWVEAGDVDVDGATGLVADVTGGSVSLAVTTPTQLLTLTDANGAGASFAPTGPTVLATAAANTEFRGVALAPTGAAGPSVFPRTPSRGATSPIDGASVPVSVFVDSAVAVTGVSVSIGSSSVAAARGAGDVWTADVPTAGLTAGPATLTVAGTDATGTTTVTRPIALSGTAAPVVPADALVAGTYAPGVAKVKKAGVWKAYATALSPTGKGIVSVRKASTATAKVYGKGLVLTFTKGPKAGKVKITVDGRSVTLDLFAKSATRATKTYTFSGAITSHLAKVTVLGTKNAKSKGIAVQFAALQVKP